MNRTVGSDVFVATGAFGRVAEDASARGRLVSPAPRAGRPETEMYSGLQPTRGSPRFAVLAVLRRHPQRIQHGICVTFLRPCAVRMVFHQSPSLPWGCPTTRLTGLLWPWPDPMMPAQTRRQPPRRQRLQRVTASSLVLFDSTTDLFFPSTVPFWP